MRRAGAHRAADFRSWVQQHLAGGAGALHRFTNQDNASRCVLDEILLDGGVLCTSEELMRQRVEVWTGLWGSREDATNCAEVKEWQLELIRMADDIGGKDDEEIFPVEAIRKCIRGAPAKAALGTDQWRPHDWAELPDEGIQQLQKILCGVEREVRWPVQALHNIAVFIWKPTVPPSERSITLTTGLYR